MGVNRESIIKLVTEKEKKESIIRLINCGGHQEKMIYI